MNTENVIPIADLVKVDQTIPLDLLRSNLRVHEAVNDLIDIANQLRTDWEFMSKNQIEAQRLRADIARLRIAKFVPDLKAVEHSVGDAQSRVQFVINLGDDQVKK